MTKSHDNDIIFMHDNFKTSATTALQVVDTLAEQGYESVTVEDIPFE